MLLSTRAATPDDLRFVMDVDAKCFDDPWGAAKWQQSSLRVAVATVNETVVGFVVFEVFSDHLAIQKIGIKPQYRRMGLSRKLMANLIKFASASRLKYVEIVVPESNCIPGTVRDITPWLSKLGFRGTSIKRDFRAFCGALEDGFIFRLEIK